MVHLAKLALIVRIPKTRKHVFLEQMNEVVAWSADDCAQNRRKG